MDKRAFLEGYLNKEAARGDQLLKLMKRFGTGTVSHRAKSLLGGNAMHPAHRSAMRGVLSQGGAPTKSILDMLRGTIEALGGQKGLGRDRIGRELEGYFGGNILKLFKNRHSIGPQRNRLASFLRSNLKEDRIMKKIDRLPMPKPKGLQLSAFDRAMLTKFRNTAGDDPQALLKLLDNYRRG